MQINNKKVFVDANVFFAFINRAHLKYGQVTAFFRYFAQEKYQLYTDVFSIIKTETEIREKISLSLSKDFIKTIVLSDINILYPTEHEVKTAIKILARSESNELDFSKALMAVLANRRNIHQICTFEYLPLLFGLTIFYLPM